MSYAIRKQNTNRIKIAFAAGLVRIHLKNPISAAITGFSAASRSSLLAIAKLFLVRLHGFCSKISHFATKAIFEMGFSQEIEENI